VKKRPGYTKTEKGSMLLSPATRLGIRMTCKDNDEYMTLCVCFITATTPFVQVNPLLNWFVMCLLNQM